ncbi:MAG: heme lyase CcmF/NrfE family subunit, partial [Actinobacteria bacterium]|nr:heme lyase CcmF/NrfE family subunit [Actinomycetota bacterium]
MIDLIDVGRLALGLAFGVAVFQLSAAALAVARRAPELALSARNAATVQAAVLTAAVASLSAGFLSRDFSIAFVADHSSRDMPVGLTLAALWGGQEGSLLYWTWVLSVFAAVATRRMLARDAELGPWGLLVLAAIQPFFVAVMAFATPPFKRLAVAPLDGRGLNPLLWDSGMQVHPPMLLMGYVSFTIPFAFAAAMLIRGRLSQAWLRELRQWMVLAWAIQSLGLLLGAWWAYRVLGWGGYWGWDPVENVALLPWLVATAYLHSALAQERRGVLRAWTVALVLLAFCLAVFGTFVVRSGILTSVHSFALSSVGPLFLGFVGLVLILSAVAFLYRLPMLRSPTRIASLASKEAGFLLNNLLLLSIAIATFWGTIYPMLSEILQGARIAVGPSFYTQVNLPLLLALLGLLGVWPLLAWRRTSRRAIWHAIRWPLLSAVAVSALLVGLGLRDGLPVLGFALCALIGAGITLEVGRGLRAGLCLPSAQRRLAVLGIFAGSRRRLGSHVVHLGIALLALGIIGSSAFKAESAVTLARGESARLGAYTLTYLGLESESSVGLETVRASVGVAR